MIDIQKIKERQKLRLEILEKLYEIYFSGGPEALRKDRNEALKGTKKEIYLDNEHHKAYVYLFNRKLIMIAPLPGASSADEEILTIHITAEGIDYVENLILGEPLS
ncbi:hypothetical protein [Paenibacillus aquistagni]|uniref:hypothetical protein n=1 Tax=Paenibacillus aquistagni TaxID=1852522 RepID=UPI00145AFBCF|nr:hypothetical protein [Paenibacillus aquistagni]NMM55571.1 hypothetical protein [Paenibacillus aquistagni]